MRNHKDTTRHSRNQIYRDELRRECSPPGTGGVDAPSRKCREASFERRGRGGQFGETFRVSDHPVCAASERELFLIGAATPPVPGGEHARLMRFADHTNKRSALSRGAGSRVPAGSVSLFLVLISLDVRLLQVRSAYPCNTPRQRNR